MRMGDLEPWQLTKIPHALSARLPFSKGDFRSLRSLFRNFRKINTLFKVGKHETASSRHQIFIER